MSQDRTKIEPKPSQNGQVTAKIDPKLSEREIWQPVLGDWGLRYEASSHGRVFSKISKRILALRHRKSGYVAVKFSGREFRLHRIVWEAFNGKIPDKMEINHIDGDKKNNRLDNLECVTRSQNLKHAYATGLMDVSGDKNPNAKLTASDIEEIRRIYAGGKYGYTKIGKMYNVSRYTIRDIIRRGAWGNK